MKKLIIGMLKSAFKEVLNELITNAALKDKLNPETVNDIEEIYRRLGNIIDRKK